MLGLAHAGFRTGFLISKDSPMPYADKEQGAYIVHCPAPAAHLDSSLMIIAPYERGFVDDFKSIPARYREWVPEHKTWVAFPPYVDRAKDLVYSYFAPVTILYAEPTPATTPQADKTPTPDSDHKLLGLLPGASERLVRAAYRVRAQEVHPDTTDNTRYKDGQVFMQVRSAYERLLTKMGVKP